MPRYLYLLRHAQSADKQTGQTDKERVLTPRGLAEARAVGFFLKELSPIPELIVTSSAIRAKATSDIIAEVLKYSPEKIVEEEELYEAQVSTFLQVLEEIDPHINCLLIVGHNPVISLFANYLIDKHNSFQPAELIRFKSSASSWKKLQKENVEMEKRFYPMV